MELQGHHACIDKELNRNATNPCNSTEVDQPAYNIRRQHSKPKGKQTGELIDVSFTVIIQFVIINFHL